MGGFIDDKAPSGFFPWAQVGKRIPQLFRAALVIAAIFAGAAHGQGEPAKKTLVFLGDSLTAGLGVETRQAFPALIQQRIDAAALPYRVINAGLSGDTSAGGLRRIDWLLQQPIDLLVIELGANDGLRGLAVTASAANLQAIIDKVKARNPQTKFVIAGMKLPPNLGADYVSQFQQIFTELAGKNKAVLIPFLLEGVGGHRELNQPDQIHPTAEGHKLVADTVWHTLQPILEAP